jgi:hypothetical protein
VNDEKKGVDKNQVNKMRQLGSHDKQAGIINFLKANMYQTSRPVSHMSLKYDPRQISSKFNLRTFREVFENSSRFS